MSVIRKKLINAVISKSFNLIDPNIHKNFHEHYEFWKQTVLANKSLTKDEKTVAMRKLDISYDRDKITMNQGTKRVCEN